MDRDPHLHPRRAGGGPARPEDPEPVHVGGYIVLNTVPVINQALGQVSGLASNLTGKNVKLPTITSAEVPQAAVDKLSKALGVKLPSNFGQVTLVRSKNLATVNAGSKPSTG